MTHDRLRDFLRIYDPARFIRPERLTWLETRILERAAMTRQDFHEDMPGFMSGVRVLALPFVPSIVAACLLVLLGAFVGRGLIETRAVGMQMTGAQYSVTGIATPWHAWIETPTEGAVQP